MGFLKSLGSIGGALLGGSFGGPQGAAIGSSIGGSLFGGSSGRKQWQVDLDNANLQREFAQNSIQWKVADAKKAGIHPLAGLGVQPFNASPSFMPGSAPDLPDMSQNIGRAVAAGFDRQQRAQSQALDALTLERAGLENQLLRSQITKINQPTNPPFPGNGGSVIPGQNSSVNITPRDLVASDGVGRDAGIANQHSYAVNHDGSVAVLPSVDAKQLVEDYGPASWIHWAKTSLNPPPPPKAPPKGTRWFWNPVTQTYSARRRPNYLKVVGDSLLHMNRKGGRIW